MHRHHFLQGSGVKGLHALAGSHTAAGQATPVPVPAAAGKRQAASTETAADDPRLIGAATPAPHGNPR